MKKPTPLNRPPVASHAEKDVVTQELPFAGKCRWDDCSQRVYHPDTPLCREHMVAAWKTVEMYESERFVASLKAETNDELKRLQERWAREDAEAKARQKKRRSEAGHVYYIRIGDLIKIGFTTYLEQRIMQYPPNAELLADHPGTKQTEQDMHGRFNAYRARGREWFRPHPKLLAHIDTVNEQFPRTEPIQQVGEAGPANQSLKVETLARKV